MNDFFPQSKSLSATLPHLLSSGTLNVNIELDGWGFAPVATTYSETQTDTTLAAKANVPTT